MIHYVEGDIFESKADFLVNPVNTVGVMGAGLAKQFKEKYPVVFHDYKEKCSSGEFDIGVLLVHTDYEKGVVNFPTKKDWKDESLLEYIEKGLKTFTRYYKEQGITSVAFPPLGCGLGGLDWKDVQPLMEKYLHNLDIDVYIYAKDLKPFRCIVAGGRDFDNYDYLKEKLDKAFRKIKDKRPIVIVSGKAKGADSLGERYAKENNLIVEEFPAEWNRKSDGSYNKGAGPQRNERMAKRAHAVVLFPGGAGTRNMLQNAKKYNLKIKDFR